MDREAPPETKRSSLPPRMLPEARRVRRNCSNSSARIAEFFERLEDPDIELAQPLLGELPVGAPVSQTGGGLLEADLLTDVGGDPEVPPAWR